MRAVPPPAVGPAGRRCTERRPRRGEVLTSGLPSPATLLELWAWVGSLTWWLQVLLWIALLPWMLALAVWQTGWPDWLRWLIIIAAAVFWTALSWPRRKRR